MNNDGLNDKQEMALELVMSGMRDGDIAKRVGTSRADGYWTGCGSGGANCAIRKKLSLKG